MPDVYAHIESLPETAIQSLVAEMEHQAGDEQNRAFLDLYLQQTPFKKNSRVLEIGCGTGAIAKQLARLDSIASVEALDVSPLLISVAQALSVDYSNLHFTVGNAHKLPWASNEFDAVIFHSTLNHIHDPSHALAEANRVLKEGGILIIFEADYAAFHLANGPSDPLELVAQATAAEASIDPWLVRRLPHLLASNGFSIENDQVFAYKITEASEHLLLLIDRGVDALLEKNLTGPVLAAALKGEVRRRIALGFFNGLLPYSWILASKPWIDAGGGI